MIECEDVKLGNPIEAFWTKIITNLEKEIPEYEQSLILMRNNLETAKKELEKETEKS